MKTSGLHDDLLLLFSSFHFFYFIFSAPISFSLCFLIFPSLFSFYDVLSRAFIKSSRKPFVYMYISQFSSVQSLSHAQLCHPMDCSTSGFPVHHQFRSFFTLMCIESVLPSSHLILCCPLLLLPSIFPSFRVFSKDSVLRLKWSFSFSFSPSNEYSGLISFRIDWFDLLAV